MHEITYAKKVIGEAQKEGARNAIEVEVGELCDIEAHEMKEALESLVSWKVIVSEIKGKVKCACGYSGKARILDKGHGYCYFDCPKCGKKPEVIEGGEIKIVGVS